MMTMKEKFLKIWVFVKGLVQRRFSLKLASVLLSVVLWFVVMNVINPLEESVYTVYLTFTNEDKITKNGIVILNKDELEKTKVNIRVKAKRTALDFLSKKENYANIKATADLNQFALIYPEDINDSVNVSVTPNLMQSSSDYQITGYEPMTVGLRLDKYVTVTMDVTVKTEGRTAEGYVASTPVCSPAQVEISGPSTYVEKVSQVRVNFDYGNSSENIEKVIIPEALDQNGNSVEGVTINTSEITVTSSVSHMGMAEIKPPRITGEPASGYVVTEVNYSPKRIEVTGDKDKIDNLKEIELNNVDISGASSTRIFKSDISDKLREVGVSAKTDENTFVEVEVKIEKKSVKEVNFTSDKIVLSGRNNELYDYSVVQETPMRLSGREVDLSKVDTSNLSAVCNVSELSEGSHSITGTVNIDSDAKIDVDNIPVFLVDVKQKEKTVQATASGEPETREPQTAETTEKYDNVEQDGGGE